MAPADTLRLKVALWYTPGIGTKTYLALCKAVPTLQDCFDRPQALTRKFNLSPQTIAALSQPDWHAIDKAMQWASCPNHHILTLHDRTYPHQLAQIASPPALLFVKGDVACLQDPQLAIVGSRYPSEYGKDNAFKFAQNFAESGITVTSGLAIGIDATAHQGALTQGQTIAVLGTGLNHIYPQQNLKLAEQIADSGALVSEFPLDMYGDKRNFPRRNRIISGLSLGTLVVEAAIRSGSLITAKQAMEQGREAFAIPGSIHNARSKGCHELIRQGAKLVESAYDILIEIKPALKNSLASPTAETPLQLPQSDAPAAVLDPEYQQMLTYIDFKPTPVDLIIERSSLTADKVSSMLLMLELKNYIASVPGGYARV